MTYALKLSKFSRRNQLSIMLNADAHDNGDVDPFFARKTS